MQYIEQFFKIKTTDLDSERNRKLLNILLVVFAFVVIVILIMSLIVSFLGFYIGSEVEVVSFLVSGTVFILGIVMLFYVNNYVSGRSASILFILLCLMLIMFSDSMFNVVAGRGLFMFAIPIVIASIFLKSTASFYFATVSSGIVVIFSLAMNIIPNVIAIGSFYLIASIIWLSASNLEKALNFSRHSFIIKLGTEQKLKDSAEKFRTLVSNIPGAVYRCAADEYWTVEIISDAIKDLSYMIMIDII